MHASKHSRSSQLVSPVLTREPRHQRRVDGAPDAARHYTGDEGNGIQRADKTRNIEPLRSARRLADGGDDGEESGEEDMALGGCHRSVNLSCVARLTSEAVVG